MKQVLKGDFEVPRVEVTMRQVSGFRLKNQRKYWSFKGVGRQDI
jgi:hypothetical protein